MKQTPQIIIEARQINCCSDCPFFEENDNMDIYHYGDAAQAFCTHPSFKAYRLMNEKKFETLTGTMIWIHCPLPDVEGE